MVSRINDFFVRVTCPTDGGQSVVIALEEIRGFTTTDNILLNTELYFTISGEDREVLIDLSAKLKAKIYHVVL